jgi:hypothetical protein
MSDDIFSEARRTFELLPGPAMMAFALKKLAAADVGRNQMRTWSLRVAAEFGVTFYIRNSLERLLKEVEDQRPKPDQEAA